MSKKYKTKEEVLSKGREIIGIPLGEIDNKKRLATDKGSVGRVIEESWFNYSSNSITGPDFAEAGVELKVTAYIKTKTSVRAKERLVCNIINYMHEHKETFETSSFWKKCETMLLMFYHYLEQVKKADYTIDEVVLFNFPADDLEIIKQDWQKIISKIRAGKAHELSEGDTMYLGACTKGATAKSVRQQPFSSKPAKQRAYSLKQSYMTQIMRTYIFGKIKCEHIIRDNKARIAFLSATCRTSFRSAC